MVILHDRGKSKIKIKLNLLKAKRWNHVLFTFYIYNLAYKFRYTQQWVSFFFFFFKSSLILNFIVVA